MTDDHTTLDQFSSAIKLEPSYEDIETVKNVMRTWYDGRTPDGMEQLTIPIMVFKIVSAYEAMRSDRKDIDAAIRDLNQRLKNVENANNVLVRAYDGSAEYVYGDGIGRITAALGLGEDFFLGRDQDEMIDELVEIVDSQRVELEAARRLIDARNTTYRLRVQYTEPHKLQEAINAERRASDAYDAVRSRNRNNV